MSFVPRRTAPPRILRSLTGRAALAALAVLAACPAPGGGKGADTRDTLAIAHARDTLRDTAPEQQIVAADTATIARLTDTSVTNAKPGSLRLGLTDALADSISDFMTFLARPQTTFVAATRGKRLLVDLGRFDGELSGAKQRRAFQDAATVLSPVRVGDKFLLRGTWGADTAEVASYALWNGRIVATLLLPHAVDSLAKGGATMIALATKLEPPKADSMAAKADSIVAAAVPPAPPAPPAVPLGARPDSAFPADSTARVDSTAPAVPACRQGAVEEALALRVAELADSLAFVLEADTAKLTDRLKKSVKTQRSQAVGCFGRWRVMLFVNQSAGDYEYVHQIALLVDSEGIAQPMSVRDLRFKAHEVIAAFDADGDGIDDVAVRGRGNRIGGTVILKFVPEKRRLEYVMGGFAWEVF
jgi:hypothetical protein